MKPQQLPHLTCFMMSSVDGRTNSDRFRLRSPAKMYETLAAKIPSEGWIVGRVTMGEILDRPAYRKRKGRFIVPKGDFVAPHKQKTYAIAIDPSGKLNWASGTLDTEHAIAVLTEKVSADYLDHLRTRGVSYILGGKTTLDLRRVLEKLRRLFGVKRLTVQGGGTVNGSFLKAGLLDAIHVLIAPAADGSRTPPTTFDAETAQGTALRLQSVKVVHRDFVLLKYTVPSR